MGWPVPRVPAEKSQFLLGGSLAACGWPQADHKAPFQQQVSGLGGWGVWAGLVRCDPRPPVAAPLLQSLWTDPLGHRPWSRGPDLVWVCPCLERAWPWGHRHAQGCALFVCPAVSGSWPRFPCSSTPPPASPAVSLSPFCPKLHAPYPPWVHGASLLLAPVSHGLLAWPHPSPGVPLLGHELLLFLGQLGGIPWGVRGT